MFSKRAMTSTYQFCEVRRLNFFAEAAPLALFKLTAYPLALPLDLFRDWGLRLAVPWNLNSLPHGKSTHRSSLLGSCLIV